MVSCKHCHTPNSLDSTFCKRCGAELPPDDLQEAKAKLERLIEEGNSLFNQARVEEALAIADAALDANPSSVTALSLKALCHERRGELAEALEAADRIVDLNPDSDFDRIRRSTLRQKLQSEYHLAETPDRRTAFVGAAAAAVLVICLGVYVAKASSSSSNASNLTASRSGDSTQPAVTPPPSAPSVNSAPSPTPSASGASAPPTSEGAATTPDSRDSASRVPPLRPQSDRSEEPAAATSGDGTLPNLGAGVVVKPVEPPVPAPAPSGSPATGVAKPAGSQGGDPDDGTGVASSKPAEDEGTYVISVHSGGGRPMNRVPSGSSSVGGTGLEALVRVGSQQFELGNFEGAAKSYEQAIQSGGDAIILNRRLGQAYQRLGRTSDASEAYHKCITAVDAALAAGRGNRASLMSTRDLCQQELKVLGG